MIQVNELRVGNMLQTIEGKKPTEVTDIQLKRVDGILLMRVDGILENEMYTFTCWGYKDNEVEAIPLTEKIIQSAGFEFIGGNVAHCYEKDKVCITYIKEGQVLLEGCSVRPRISYVHQLQNLVYSLTQTELEIKL